jgi:hypothetical protein
MNLTSEEIKSLENAKTESEWNKICDQIKVKRDGNYPEDWYEKVVLKNLNANIDKTAHIVTL